ncbi:MAG: ubiquinol-cytochrome c reductase iron-sulfur subunit [Burkholderiales bacterium]|nr:ubiquinol-cytochrome c reductase iron-sulfur subunit [Burkholderiales bacterium]
MGDSAEFDPTRRSLLVATASAGGIAVVGTATPFVASMLPSERARALGAPVEANIASLKPGEMQIVEWRGKPVWIIRRTPEMLESIKKSDDLLSDPQSRASDQPDYAHNEFRSRKPEVGVLVGVCTHLGCSPQLKSVEDKGEMGADWLGGFYCPCHGSKFDFAGRVYSGAPAPINLPVPPYAFVSDSEVLIGEDKKEA